MRISRQQWFGSGREQQEEILIKMICMHGVQPTCPSVPPNHKPSNQLGDCFCRKSRDCDPGRGGGPMLSQAEWKMSVQLAEAGLDGQSHGNN